MKVKVIKKAWYNQEYLKTGRIIDLKGDKLPSWAEEIKEDKKVETQGVIGDKGEENKTPVNNNEGKEGEENKTPVNNNEGKEGEENKTPVNNNEGKEGEENKGNGILKEVEQQQYLDLLINEAIEKNILIEDADKKSVEEQIKELETRLNKGN